MRATTSRNGYGRRIVGVALLWTAATVAAAFQVEVEPSSTVPLAQFRTFEVRAGTPAQRPATQDFIEDAVRSELQRIGLRPARSAPDLQVVTHALVDEQSLAELAKPDYWEFITGLGNVSAFDVRAGTLVLDLEDATTGERLWRGLVSESVHGSARRVRKQIRRAVRKLVERIPR